MPLTPAKSTAISDGILAASCIWALYKLNGKFIAHPADVAEQVAKQLREQPSSYNQLAQVWFALLLAASSVGVFRFGWRNFFERLTPVHETVSWFALVVGLPCLTAQFYYNADLWMLANIHLLAMVPALLAWIGGDRNNKNRITRYLALFCDLSLALNGIYNHNYYQLLAAISMILASWVVSSNQNKLGLPPVDWFHYGIVASNCFIVAALGRASIPGVDILRQITNKMPSMFG